MAEFDFEPPSFSLGLDLDGDSEPLPTTSTDPLSRQAKGLSTSANICTIEEDDVDGFDSPVRVSDCPPTLKRLRRGFTHRLASEAKVRFEDGRCNVDDDIEEFSSEEDLPKAGSVPPNFICGSSKGSLHGQNVVTSESGSHWKSGKGKEVSSGSASANVETKGSNVVFPKLTVSPLRRFQLIDSDSDHDDPCVTEDSSKDVPCVTLPPKIKQSDSGLETEKSLFGNCQNEDLWKGFHSEKSYRVPTPAFDEICDEFFSNSKNKSHAESEHRKDANRGSFLPPAHCYFFHDDSKIRKLVHDRLPYFFPLGAGNNLEQKLPNASVIDYMGQFGHDENSGQANRQPVEKSSTRKNRNAKKLHVGNTSQDFNSWVNPKTSAGPPTNAGNRRVQAVSNSGGTVTGASVSRWCTDSSGRKVYVNKNGQELTGQIAYRHYRKESGMGFKNSKKKPAVAKKKSGSQKKAASKKK